MCVYLPQFYVHPAMGVRVLSKEDVLLYVKEMKIAECDTDGQCDTNSRDNVYFLLHNKSLCLSHSETNLYHYIVDSSKGGVQPKLVAARWVKEIVYRKIMDDKRKYLVHKK